MNSDKMNSDKMKDKLYKFKVNMSCAYHTYGWGIILRTASNLYEDNLNLEEEHLVLNDKLDKYKKEIDRLQSLLSSGVDEMTENLLSFSLDTVKSNEILT
jgi:hypothetical protein